MPLTRATTLLLVLAVVVAGCGKADTNGRPAGSAAGDVDRDVTAPPPPPPEPTHPSRSGTPPPVDRSPASADKPAPVEAPKPHTHRPHGATAAEPPGPQQPPQANDSFAAIDAFVAHMKTAAAALRAQPARLELGQRIDVRLRVSPKSTESALRNTLQGPGATVDAGTARIAPRMKAQLIVPEGASVAIVGSDEQAVRDNEDTEWRWTVTPGAVGELPIRVRLTAPVTIDGKETAYDVRTFEASVTVFVTPTTRVIGFVERNWQWLWTALIVPVWAWWRKRPAATSRSDTAET